MKTRFEETGSRMTMWTRWHSHQRFEHAATPGQRGPGGRGGSTEDLCFLLSKWNKGRHSPPRGMRRAAVSLSLPPHPRAPIKEHEEMQMANQIFDFYIFQFVHAPSNEFMALLGAWAPTSFLSIGERTEKTDSKVTQSLERVSSPLPSFVLHKPSRMAKVKVGSAEKRVCFPISAVFLFKAKQSWHLPVCLPCWPKAAHMGPRPNSVVDNLLCV